MYHEPQPWTMYNPEFVRNIHTRRKAEAIERDRNRRRAEQREWQEAQVKRRRFRRRWIEMVKLAAKHNSAERRADQEAMEAEMAMAFIIKSPSNLMIDTARNLCALHDYSLADILGPSRTRSLVDQRHHLCWTLRKEHPDKSFPEIGCFMNRDHTTIMYAVNKWEKRRKGYGL